MPRPVTPPRFWVGSGDKGTKGSMSFGHWNKVVAIAASKGAVDLNTVDD